MLPVTGSQLYEQPPAGRSKSSIKEVLQTFSAHLISDTRKYIKTQQSTKIMSIRRFAINAYLAFEGIFRRCPGNSRCGLLGLSVNMHSGIRGSDNCQEVCVFFLDPTLQCGRCVNEFDITVQLVNIPTEDQILVENARQRWESIIVGDVADVSPSIGFRDLLPRTCNQPYRVDDVFVCVRNEYIEDFLATGRALVVRQRNDLPVVGEVVVDIDYIKSLNGTLDTFLEDAILQIMGYSLGK